MSAERPLTIEARGDRDIVMTRTFAAPRRLVFEANTKPELIRRWLLGPPGWTMITCEVDLRVGGAYRYVWRNEKGTVMGMGGVYTQISPPEKIVATERFDEAWYEGDATCATTFTEKDGLTTLTLTVTYDSKAIRDAVLASGMGRGVEASYDRLDGILAAAEKK